jgi:tetraacyldisaccharide 4'-kinase
MRPLLLPFSYVFGAGVVLRNWFFEIGALRSLPVGVPVISVGNIESGGVGKTPFVELLVKKFIQKGRKVAVVSRGYKRSGSGTVVVSNGSVQCAEASESGDEPAQMASKLTGVIVIVDEQRVRGALYAIEKFGVNIIILDDGFQHRYLRRDADIVILSVEDIQKPGWMLPAGNRREPLSSLRRASLIAISRCESIEEFEKAQAVVRGWTDKSVIGLSTKVSAFRRASSRFSVDLAGLKGKSALAFSGIGNPQSFEKTLRSVGLEVKKHVVFSDHHSYSDNELRDLENEVRELSVDFLVTTEKDVARLNTGDSGRMSFLERVPLFYAEIEQAVMSGESVLNELIDRF